MNFLCPLLWQAKLQVGDVVKCCIKKITYFGIFVEVTEISTFVFPKQIFYAFNIDFFYFYFFHSIPISDGLLKAILLVGIGHHVFYISMLYIQLHLLNMEQRMGYLIQDRFLKIFWTLLMQIDGVPALIHQTEVSWDATLDPLSYFKIGQVLVDNYVTANWNCLFEVPNIIRA